MLNDMVKHLTQLREIIKNALRNTAKLNKSYTTFFTVTMTCFLHISGRLNFTNLARFSTLSESCFRQNFKKLFDWLGFNMQFVPEDKRGGDRHAIAIDPSYIKKSGKKTHGVSYFWSGVDGRPKKGLEILGMAFVDADAMAATFLQATQTIPGKQKGRKPKCTEGMDDRDSLIAKYLGVISKRAKKLRKLAGIVVADAYFSKRGFADGLSALDFDLVSRLRDDAALRYLYEGQKTGKRGRPKKFGDRVDIDNPDMRIFKSETLEIDGRFSEVLWADIWSVGLRRVVRVVIVSCLDEDSKARRRILFSTRLTMCAKDIVDVYRCRFQIEFLFRDAKQHFGLTHCQARNENALNFAFNVSLSAINIAREFSRAAGMKLSMSDVKILIHNAVMLEKFFSELGKSPNSVKNTSSFKELLFYGVKAVS